MIQKIALRFSKLAVLTVIFTFFTQCSRNPVSGKKEIMFMSESQEIALGTESNPQVLAEFGEYPEPKLQTYLDEIGQRMAKVSHRPNYLFISKLSILKW